MVGKSSESTEPPNGAAHPLPSVGSYVRAVLALGWASLRSSWPLLAVITFFEKWLESYFKLMKDEGQLSSSSFIAAGSAFGLILTLLYAPLLQLQDSALRGSPRSLWGSCRATWARLPAFLACVGLEGLILSPLVLFVVPLVLSVNAAARDAVLPLLWAVTGLVCLATATLLFGFVGPLVLLDSQKAPNAILMSIRMVAHHFGGLLGRLSVLCLGAGISYGLLFILFFLLTALLDQWGAKTIEFVPIVLYELAATALIASCSVSAWLILYRSLKPPGNDVPSAATVASRQTPPFG